MAPTSVLSKSKKASEKPTLKAKTKPTVSTPILAESSSKPSKSLKRKNDDEENEPKHTLSKQPAKIAKKPKVDAPTKASKPTSTKEAPVESQPKADKKKSAPVESNKKSKFSSDLPTSISRPIKSASTRSELKSSKKARLPSPEPEFSDEEDVESNAGEGVESDQEDVVLHGFSTDDEDSSDEDDDMDAGPSEFDMGKLPTIAKDDESVKRKLEKAKRQHTEDRGVLFLGRLPHGFYEDQIKAYFSQFGDVTRLRVSRNKKTGKSKHYGFVEFESSAVAKIVAETMDNYLIMGHILRCKLIPKEEVHPELWVGANRKWRLVPQDRVSRVQHNKIRSEEEQKRAAKRLLKRQSQRKRKMADLGIKYDLEGVGYKMTVPKVGVV